MELPNYITESFDSHPPTDEVLTNLVEALQSALAHAAASPAVLQALREVHRIQTAAAEAVTLSTISDSVASAFRLAPVDLTDSRKHDARTAMARQIAICISRRLTKASFPALGRHYHRDHATTVYACQQIEWRMARDSAFRQFIEKLEGQIGMTATTQARREVRHGISTRSATSPMENAHRGIHGLGALRHSRLESSNHHQPRQESRREHRRASELRDRR